MNSVYSKTTNSTHPAVNILSLKDFCIATKKVYDIEIPNIDIIVNDPDGWTKLADLWEEYGDAYDVTPFHQVASYVIYAYDFVFPSSLSKAFLLAICRELCGDGPAGIAWRKHPLFKRALDEVEPEKDSDYVSRLFSEDGCIVSIQHCYYLEQRMMLRYWISEGVHNNKCDVASRYIAAYENFITDLCPEVSGWTSDYWIDVEHIYDALQRELRSDHRISPREYDVLICVFRMETSTCTLTGDKEHDHLRCVFNLRYFSMEWAQIIWPIDTEKNIIKMYYLAKDFVDHDCAYADILYPCYVYDVDDHVFTRSWIYSVVQEWLDTGDLHTRYENDYKKAMFEISLNI